MRRCPFNRRPLQHHLLAQERAPSEVLQAPVSGEKAPVERAAVPIPSPAVATNTPGETRPTNDPAAALLTPPSPQQVAGMTTLLHRLDGSSNVANALFTAINLVPLSAQQKRAVEGALTPEQWNHLETLAKDLGSDFKATGTKILFNLSHNLGLDYERLLSPTEIRPSRPDPQGSLNDSHGTR